MKGKLKKRLLLAAKLLVAAALLLWVFGQAHWDDYVVAKDGSTWTWLDRTQDERSMVEESPVSAIRHGRLFDRQTRLFAADEFVPVAGTEDQYVRDGMAATLATVNKPLLLLAVAIFPLNIVIVGLRLWFLLRIQGVRLRAWECIRLTFLGQFFNMVVPGTVGGDVVKAWYVCKHTPRVAAVLVSMFVDRVMGLVELMMMAGVMLAIVLLAGLESWQRMTVPAITVGVVACIVAVAMAFLLSRRLRGALRLQTYYERLPIAHHIEAAGKAARIYRRRLGVLGRAVLVTLGAHAIFIGSFALIGVSLHLDVPFYQYFVYLPLIYIIGAVPITPGGLGLVEKLYVTFFVTAGAAGGATAMEVVTLAMLARLLPVFWGLPGLYVAVTGPKLPKAEAMEAELAAAENADLHN
ncbi:MAG: flippase-like domain-containing protein [Planctomycetes bacterium]|jgi:uncharacterized protein (TIRG00374 family)|nr:flippase-like domain-containing protein [Planctomycetota bacterium]